MATSTFDKTFVVKPEEMDRVLKVIRSNEPAKPIKTPPYTVKEKDRGEEALKLFLSHYKK